MIKIFKSSFLFILLINCSCNLFFQPMPSSWKWGLKPRPLTGVANFPSSDSEYGKGFRDGCVAGWDSVGKGVITDLKQVYEYKRLKKSPDYNTGWFEGYEHCTCILDWEVP